MVEDGRAEHGVGRERPDRLGAFQLVALDAT
jgi:hypothetical protein